VGFINTFKQYFLLPNLTISSDISVAFWYKIDPVLPEGDIITIFELATSSNMSDLNCSFPGPGSTTFVFCNQWAGVPRGTLSALEGVQWDLGWHHVAFTVSGLVGNVWIDGWLVGAMTFSGVRQQTVLRFNSLGTNVDRSSFFTGYLDEFRIYNRSLTGYEVNAIVNAWSPTGLMMPVLCPSGTYASGIGYTACKTCPISCRRVAPAGLDPLQHGPTPRRAQHVWKAPSPAPPRA